VASKRVIPVLLLRNAGLVKGTRFKDHFYVGDPINAVKIFNDKEVDELIFLDISARERKEINFELLSQISSEAFMPFAYGGGINNCLQIERLFRTGVEKVVLNSELFQRPGLLSEAVTIAGSQSIVACVDVRKSFFGKYEVYANNGKTKTGVSLADHLKFLVDNGVGEVVVQSIDKEGTLSGLDIPLMTDVAKSVGVPVVASGGASGMEDIRAAFRASALSGVAAGSLFVFHGKHRAVLITYPDRTELGKR
jgi:imidazole glycerol-phosphate synthase subunit HisF